MAAQELRQRLVSTHVVRLNMTATRAANSWLASRAWHTVCSPLFSRWLSRLERELVMSNVNKPYVIVAGVDYSETGELALDQAIEIAGAIAAAGSPVEVHAVNVVSVVPPATWSGYAPANALPGIRMNEAHAELERHLTTKFAALREKYRKNAEIHLPRIFGHIGIELPAQQIAQLASDLEADLVVVGTHGRRGTARILLGSVAEGVVRLAPCPVLVVRPKQLVTVATIEPPCPQCVETRQATGGERMWCEQHSERHGQRHTYHQDDRASGDTNMPLVFHT